MAKAVTGVGMGVGQQGVTCPGHDLGGIASEDVSVTSVETDDDGPSSAAVGACQEAETGSGAY